MSTKNSKTADLRQKAVHEFKQFVVEYWGRTNSGIFFFYSGAIAKSDFWRTSERIVAKAAQTFLDRQCRRARASICSGSRKSLTVPGGCK